MDSVHTSDKTGDMAFLSSETLGSRLCKSAERVQKKLYFSNRPIKINHNPTDRAKGPAKKRHQECPYFWESLYGECRVDSGPQVHVFIK